MIKPRRFRTLPPGALEVEMTEMAAALPLHDLEVVLAVLTRELDFRTGRQKFQIPPHVQAMLN
ncbi:MAG: hypothetical protein K9K68_02265 [Methylococcaceae bacterium]|nr:hypothetical protein [Methylococcaceae bacterium]